MKIYIPIMFAAIAFAISSCGGGKSADPVPTAATTGSTTGTTNGGTPTSGGTTTTPTFKRIDIATLGGNFAVAADGSLMSISLSDAFNNKSFMTKLGSAGANTTTVTSLEHGEGAVFDKTTQVWEATWPAYSPTDTAKQVYIRTIFTDANKNVIEYRAYINRATSPLALYQTVVPATMDLATYKAILATKNTQYVLQAVQ